MIELRTTETFDKWLASLKDRQIKARIHMRIDRLLKGNPGDVSSVGEGVSEMRLFHRPGYRLYFVQRGSTVVVLLCGGNKDTQQRDIAKAKLLAKNVED